MRVFGLPLHNEDLLSSPGAEIPKCGLFTMRRRNNNQRKFSTILMKFRKILAYY